MFSQAQRIALAQTKLQLAGAAPELHNMHEVYKDMYEALGVKDTDRIMKRIPDEEPEPKDPAQENIDALDMVPLQAFEGQEHEAHIMAHMVFGSTPMVAGMPAIAISLQKHIMEHVRIAARERAAVQFIQSRQAVGGAAATEEEMLQVEGLTAQFVAEGMQMVKQLSQQVSGQGPDPLVQLKEQELQIRAQAEQADAQNEAAKLNLDAQNQQMRASQFQQKLASQEKQTQARIQSAMERELLKKQ
jgi:glutamate-1-semialdehyde aminotransferase